MTDDVAALVAELRARINGYDRYDKNFYRQDDVEMDMRAADALTAQAAENARLREALTFYANLEDYKLPFRGALYFDCGQRARVALMKETNDAG